MLLSALLGWGLWVDALVSAALSLVVLCLCCVFVCCNVLFTTSFVPDTFHPPAPMLRYSELAAPTINTQGAKKLWPAAREPINR